MHQKLTYKLVVFLCGNAKCVLYSRLIKGFAILKIVLLSFARRFVFKICFTEYPSGCTTFNGTHSLDCLKSLWDISGCAMEGYDHPDNLSSAEFNTSSATDLKCIHFFNFLRIINQNLL